MMLNHDVMIQLIAASREDRELLDMIRDALSAFEEYHAAVMEDQTFRLIYGGGGMEGEEYRTQSSALDRRRTVLHNGLLVHLNLLNRMAAQAGLPPVYDGVVSEERPYRRRAADAVFAYLSRIIENRS